MEVYLYLYLYCLTNLSSKSACSSFPEMQQKHAVDYFKAKTIAYIILDNELFFCFKDHIHDELDPPVVRPTGP